MSNKRKVKKSEMREMLKRFNSMTQVEQKEFAMMNKMTVERCKEVLEDNCFYVGNLNLTEMRKLRKEIEVMSDDCIKAIERVNNATIDTVIENLDEIIFEKEDLSRRKREFNKLWKVREKEVERKLVEEGLYEVLPYGGRSSNIFECRKRMLEAQAELARELGLHFKTYDPFYGWIES